VDPRQRAPRSADQIDAAPAHFVGPAERGNRCRHRCAQLARALRAQRGNAQRAERKRCALSHLAAAHPDQFEAAAAHVGSDPIGLRQSGYHPIARCDRLGISIEQHGGQAQRAHCLDKFRPIGRLAHSGSGDDLERIQLHPPQQRGEPRQTRQRGGDRRGIERPGADHAVTQPGHDLFIVQHHRRARRAAEHHQPDRVGPDIDDGLTSGGGRTAGIAHAGSLEGKGPNDNCPIHNPFAPV